MKTNKSIKNIFRFAPLLKLVFASSLIIVPIIKAAAMPKNSGDKNSTEDFKIALEHEASKVLNQLEQTSTENFLNIQDLQIEAKKITNINKFKKDFNDFINKVKANPNSNLETLAKTTLAARGIDFDKIKKQYQAKTKFLTTSFSSAVIMPRRKSMWGVPLPWDPKKVSFQRIPAEGIPQDDSSFKQFSAGIWKAHVKTATFAAISFGLAVAYGIALNFIAAVSAGAAGATLTYLSTKYRQLYDELEKAAFDIRNKFDNPLANETQIVGIIGSVNKWARGVLSLASSLKKMQMTVRPILLTSSAISKIGVVVSLIDLTQGLISELLDRLVVITK
ncbi:hypothetical protein [Mycoplasma sp. 'Moose RK']|uniref:hypothetical protein n=1 Tax=Mycoplasma sp. 'Moose RK' TaxID=2780095 RepID=UPI0018C33E6C|nr:hypothetical protein [Mycoplasma sp. 'Moose RK']MBG0730794.1 hypothetical protein [Mycoplasma sp. 'Moose RK']